MRGRSYRQFLAELAAMLEMGVPVVGALEDARFHMSEPQFKSAIENILDDITMSRGTLQLAVSETKFFSTVEVAVIGAGERSGMLGLAIARLTDNDHLPTMANQYRGFWTTLSIMVGSGVPLLESLHVCAGTCEGPLLKGIDILRPAIQRGSTLAEAMATTLAFSSTEGKIIAAAEEIGDLATAMRTIAELS